MSKVKVEEITTKKWESSTFNFRAVLNGYDVNILYKMGLIPTYQRSLTISIDDLPQLIDVLSGLHDALKTTQSDNQ